MKLRSKILSSFLILAIMLSVAGLLSIYEFNKIGKSVQSLLDENYKSINAAKLMLEALERQDSGTLLLLLGDWENGRSTIDKSAEEFRKAFQIARNNVTISNEGKVIQLIESKYKIYKDLWERPLVGTQKEGNLGWYFEQVRPAFMNVKTEVKTLMNLNDKTMYQTASELKNRAARSITPGIVAIIAALVFTALFNFFISLYVITPIKKLAHDVETFTKTGKWPAIRAQSKDEISKLSEAIQNLITCQERKDS